MSRKKFDAVFFVSSHGLVTTKSNPLTPKERLSVINERGLICEECGSKLRIWGMNYSTPFDLDKSRKAHVDHIIPRSRGGQNTKENLRVVCQSCNCSKGAY